MDSARTPDGGGATGEPDRLEGHFQLLRPYLTSVAYSMLGSVSEAEDAVQESWLRLGRVDTGSIDDLRAWLTTVVGRICLDMLKARQARREDQAGMWLPEPLLAEPATDGPESRAVMAESIGLALLIVLESLTPPERLAFVLHDIFAVPFENIGQITGRTSEAARQLASRARRRAQAAPQPDPDPPAQRRAVDAFLSAAREGDFAGLLEVLTPRWCSGSIPARARQRRWRSPAPRRSPATSRAPRRAGCLTRSRSPSTARPGRCTAPGTSRCACLASPWHTAGSPNSTW
jgi:RNA polymerase sigma factor (sigma-70 family)